MFLLEHKKRQQKLQCVQPPSRLPWECLTGIQKAPKDIEAFGHWVLALQKGWCDGMDFGEVKGAESDCKMLLPYGVAPGRRKLEVDGDKAMSGITPKAWNNPEGLHG